MVQAAFFITSTGWGGLEMNTLKLAFSLRKRNYDISIYTIKSSKFYEKALESNMPVILINKPGRYFDISSAYRISSLLKKNGHNIIFLSHNRDIEIISLSKRLFYPGLKIIYQQHMQLSIKKKDIFHRIRYSNINYWISPLNYLKQQVIEKTTIPENKIKVIPLGVKTERFVNRKYTKEEARKKLNIETKELLIGTIGRIDPKKGQDFLIRALIELRKRNVNTELLIIGSATVNDETSNEYYNELKNFVKTNNLENICHFREHNEEVELFYNSIDIFALASQAETYGMVTIEAMLSGVPIIASNSAGSPEILNNGEYGSLYEVNDLNEFCNKLVSVINEQEITKAKTEAANKYVIKNYSLETEVNKIDELIINA
jgi:D-inositol-3-phosphate glycosyltransferase